MSSAGAVPIKTKLSTAAVGKAEAEIQAKQANVKDLKNIDIDSQHLNYEISSIPCESWWKTEEKDVNNNLSHSMSVFPIIHIIRVDLYIFEQFLLFKTSETQSTIISACASSARFFPAKLNSLAKNLAMDIDCAMVVPSYSNTGSTPHGVSKVLIKYYIFPMCKKVCRNSLGFIVGHSSLRSR